MVPDFAIARLWVTRPWLLCTNANSTQRAVPPGSVDEYQRLGSKRAYHAMHKPRICGLAASAGVRLRAQETEISAALWAFEARGRTMKTYNRNKQNTSHKDLPNEALHLVMLATM